MKVNRAAPLSVGKQTDGKSLRLQLFCFAPPAADIQSIRCHFRDGPVISLDLKERKLAEGSVCSSLPTDCQLNQAARFFAALTSGVKIYPQLYSRSGSSAMIRQVRAVSDGPFLDQRHWSFIRNRARPPVF
jgi:hypothetical protein